MTHDIWMAWKNYWLTKEQLLTFVFSKTMRCDQLLHILWFLYLSSGDKAIENDDQTYGKDLNVTYSNYYTSSEHLAVDEIGYFQGNKKHKCSGMNICKLCDMSGYT
jgi:hypothetical protein